MAQKKISELPLTKSINADDMFPIVQSGATKQISYSDLKNPMIDEIKMASINNYVENTPEVIGTWIDGRKVKRYIATPSKIKKITYVTNQSSGSTASGLKIDDDEFLIENADVVLNAFCVYDKLPMSLSSMRYNDEVIFPYGFNSANMSYVNFMIVEYISNI